MENASKYRELTNNRSLFYTIMYEKDHPVIMGRIESAIMTAVENGQYIVSIEMHNLSPYDIKMITRVLEYYEFSADWHPIQNDDEYCQTVSLVIHWA